jgi:hypothetical protein
MIDRDVRPEQGGVFDAQGVLIRGTVELSTDETLQGEVSRKVLRRYLGDEGERYLDDMLQDGKPGKNRVVEKIIPEHMSGWDFRSCPAPAALRPLSIPMPLMPPSLSGAPAAWLSPWLRSVRSCPRVHQLEEPQLAHESALRYPTPGASGMIHDQRFLGRQRDEGALGRHEARRVQHAVTDMPHLAVPPLIVE